MILFQKWSNFKNDPTSKITQFHKWPKFKSVLIKKCACANTQIQLQSKWPIDPTYAIFLKGPRYDNHKYNSAGSPTFNFWDWMGSSLRGLFIPGLNTLLHVRVLPRGIRLSTHAYSETAPNKGPFFTIYFRTQNIDFQQNSVFHG